MNEREKAKTAGIGGKEIHFDCPMNQYTTFRVGGNVDALYFAQELNGLQRMVSYLGEEDIPYLVVGNGSNLLVRDRGFKGVVVMLRGKLAAIEKGEENDRTVLAGGGTSIGELLNYCKSKGLEGLEFLAGIPGSVGGAIAMNASAWGKEIGGMVQEAQIVTPKEELAIWDHSQLNFFYRGLSIPKGSVIIRVRFELNRTNPEIVVHRMANYLARRKEKQPLEYPSGGSVFKNPPGEYAGRLIEKAGLKGERIGGAMISPKHANFIVNTGGARAEDILALMDLAREKVREKTGIELETEIRVVP
ncbi:MAG: UDP-N-acetylmuramate dehydrogenase [Deltaproteobacteria bacterium]|nr:UDP-N-acetylmuramate dehydrogenase [Deltaproteobacteria bacterium]